MGNCRVCCTAVSEHTGQALGVYRYSDPDHQTLITQTLITIP